MPNLSPGPEPKPEPASTLRPEPNPTPRPKGLLRKSSGITMDLLWPRPGPGPGPRVPGRPMAQMAQMSIFQFLFVQFSEVAKTQNFSQLHQKRNV